MSAILAEFRKEYLTYPTDPEDCKQIEKTLGTRWNVSHAVGALEVKHIAIQKPKKSGWGYYDHKGCLFAQVLLEILLCSVNYFFIR